MRLSFLILFLFFFISCNQRDKMPKDVYSPKKMEPILLDYFNAEAYAKELHKKDSSINDTTESLRLQQLVFKKHKISKEDFYRNFNYYNSHPELMAQVLDSLIAHHAEVEKRIRKRLFFKEYE